MECAKCHTLQKPQVELKIYIKNWWENACSNIECELISQLNIGHKSPKKKNPVRYECRYHPDKKKHLFVKRNPSSN